MTYKEIQKLVGAILERRDPKYTSQSGAFLELLREYAVKDGLEEMASAISLYGEAFPESNLFVKARVPSILVNHLFCVRKDLDFGAFMQWSLEKGEWASPIRDTCHDPALLRGAVENIVRLVAEYKENFPLKNER